MRKCRPRPWRACVQYAARSTNVYLDDEKAGLPADAVAASLGCGNPTALAELKPGETVLDFGSGGGIDVLLSARRVGPLGKDLQTRHDRRRCSHSRATTSGQPAWRTLSF